MICPNCQNDNREGANFCDSCGRRLALVCPACGTDNRPGARFCDHCGHSLTPAEDGSAAPAAPHPQTPVEKFIPREFAGKLEAARDSRLMEGERRIVTMLFCDVKGSTAAAEQLDPEEWTDIINGAFEHMITPVYRYEGTVARLMGDGILAFFGAPIAHEDDPERGVMAGLDIAAAIGRYREQIRAAWQIDLNVRVGINTGLVVVGAVGSDLRMEYTAMGDAINLAARMEQAAEPGTVRVAEDTYRLVAPLFDFDYLGELEVKGKREPVASYRALARRAIPGRVRGIEGVESTLVGRERELAALRDLAARVRRGDGQIVSLIAEAGLGKSRLIAELKALEAGGEADPPLRWSELGGTSYGSSRPYEPFQSQVRLKAGITPADPPDIARGKLRATVEHEPEGELLQGIYERLLGLNPEAAADLKGEAYKQALFEAILDATRREIGGRPSVYVFEDMHWTDTASLELALRLTGLARELPVLMLFSFRPDHEAAIGEMRDQWRAEFGERYTEIELQPLEPAASARLVENLLDIPNLPAGLRTAIRDKAEGNPFFAEEIVRTLLESGLVVRDDRGTRWADPSVLAAIEIPESVQALLAARIDRLAEDVRRTLQLAAVIGRTFYRRVLQAISEAAGRLDDHLRTLEAADFIHEAARVPEWEYIFRHALTQEAVYETLLHRHRREFHQRVGRALEALFPDRLEELAPILAHHFDEGRERERAFHYHAMAGHAAYDLNAFQEAHTHYERAAALLPADPEDRDRLVRLFRRRGRTLELLLDYDAAVASYEEMEARGRESGHDALVLAGWIGLATIRATFTPAHDTGRAIALSEQALALARRLGDRESESKALWNLALAYGFGDDPRRAIEHGEASLAIAKELDLVRQIPVTMNDLFRAYYFAGEIDRAQELLEETRERLRAVKNLPMLASNLINSGVFYVQLGEYDRALASLEEATAISRAIGNLGGEVGGGFAHSLVLMEQGEYDRAFQFAHEMLRLAEKVGQSGEIAFNYINLSWTLSHLGVPEEAVAYARKAADLSRGAIFIFPYALAALAYAQWAGGDRAAAAETLGEALEAIDMDSWFLYHPIAFLVQAELLLAAGQIDEAKAATGVLVEKMYRYRSRTWRADTLLLRARVLRQVGREDEAVICLEKGQAEAAALGARRILWQILAALAEIEEERGEPTAAAAHREEARHLIAFIADHLSVNGEGIDMRSAFLALPDVRALLSV